MASITKLFLSIGSRIIVIIAGEPSILGTVGMMTCVAVSLGTSCGVMNLSLEC